MSGQEYRVVPAPIRARRQRGESAAQALSRATQRLLEEMAAEGWVYLGRERAAIEQKKGLFGGWERDSEDLLLFTRESRLRDPIGAPVEAQPQRAAQPAPAVGPADPGRSGADEG